MAHSLIRMDGHRCRRFFPHIWRLSSAELLTAGEIHKGGEAFDTSLALALFDSFSCIFRVVLVLHTRILRIAGTLLEPSKGIIIPKALIIFL